MKKYTKRMLSFLLAVIMVVTMIPTTAWGAEKTEDTLKTQLRNSVSDEEYPNGLFGLGETQLSVTEGKKTKITIVRQGNTDKKATVHFKAVDISAAYGEDYVLTVIHSAVKKEQLAAPEGNKPLMEENGSIDAVEDTDVMITESEEEKEQQTKVQAQEVSAKKESSLGAAYTLQNAKEAPENDWKETNPENASEEMTAAMDEGKEASLEVLEQASGIETTVTFKPGEYKKEIICKTLDDDKSESEEQVAFFLYDAKGAEIGSDYSGYVNIKDDEEAQENVFAVENKNVSVKNGEESAKVTIVRKSGIDQIAFVTVGTKSNTAVAGQDYEPMTQELFFPAGSTSQTVEIPILGDRSETKTFYVGISEDGIVRDEENAATLVTIKEKKEEESTSSKETKAATAKMSAKTTSNVAISNKGNIGSGGAFVASGIDLRFADAITISYSVSGSSSKRKCNKTTWYRDKRIAINVTDQSGRNVLTFSEDRAGVDSYNNTKTFSRSFENSSQFTSWDSLSSAKIWVNAIGLNGNGNSSIRVTSIEVNYPGFTFQINNDSSYSYYKEKQFTGADKYTEKQQIKLGTAYFGSNTTTTTTTLYNESKLNVHYTFSGQKNSKNTPANANTVVLKGYRLQKPNTNNQYSDIIDFSKTVIDKKFLNTYKNYMYNGRHFILVPVFEVKTANVTFNNTNAMVDGKVNAKGNFKGYTAGSTYKNISKLDTLVVQGAANAGYAVDSISLQSGTYNVSNATEDNDKTTLTCGLGDTSNTAYTVYMNYESANIKIMADPSFANTEGIRKGKVIYTDEDNNVFTGDYANLLRLDGIFMNTTYNIVGIAEAGYRPVWRDGTLDYNEDGMIEDVSTSYSAFTPVKGNVLPYTTQTAQGRVYYSFETQQEVGEPADIFGFVTIRDRYILTNEEFDRGVNGANITVDGNQVQTTTGGTNKNNQKEGFFRVESDTFSVRDYYLVNVNAYGDEGEINTAFVMNPGVLKECLIDTADDLTISNAAVYVKNGDGEYVAQKITKDSLGYYSALTNGDKDYRLELKADKAGVSIASGKLQFYNAEGKKLDKTVTATPADQENSGYFYFDFNPKELGLPSGTTLRVTFTDNQDHTYLQRKVGMSLSQAVGNLDIANSFTFGGVNTVVNLIGKVDSFFDMGWNGDFDDTLGDNVTNDEETGDKIIAVGFNKEVVNKKSNRTAIQRAADSLAKKEQEIADANKKLAEKSKELADQSSVSDSDKKEYEELIANVEKATDARNKEKKAYEEKVKNAQNPQKTTTSLASSANLELGFSFMMTFGKDEKNQYYFKSMVLSGSVTGGGSVTVKFATPIGISINLGFAAGGDGSATFVVEERQDQMNPKKYYIQDINEEGEGIKVFDCNMNDANRKFDGYGSFSLNPYIQLSVGAGVLGNLIEVSISGAATFNMQFFTTAGNNSGSVTLSSKLNVKVLMISHSWTIASTNVNLFGNTRSAALGMDDLNYLYDSADVLQADDISYMRGGSRWKNGKISTRSLDESTEAYDEKNIADKIGENPDFKMISIGNGQYLAVFTNVDAKRDALNAKAVYYTIYHPTTGWSTPSMIENDGTLDQYPDIFDLGDRGAVITWSSAEEEFTDADSRVAMQNSLDLHCIFFDKETQQFGDIQKVTKHTTDTEAEENDTYSNYSDYCADVSANVSYSDNEMIIYYQKKEYASGQEEYLGDVLFPQVSLMAARTYTFKDTTGVNGTWTDTYAASEKEAMKQELINQDQLTSEDAEKRVEAYEDCFYGQRMFSFLPSVKIEEQLDEEGYWEEGTEATPSELTETASNACLIIDTDAMSYNELGVFAYTVDMDGDLETCDDRDIYMQIYDFKEDSFLHPIVITSDTVEDQSIQFARVKNETYLTWLHDGDIVALNMSHIVGNYNELLIKGKTSGGDTYYYINKSRPAKDSGEDTICYEPPMTIVEGEKAEQQDDAVSAIADFDVEASDTYVYFMWTQMNGTLKDGVEEGSYEASDPANALTETQMYTARYDVANQEATKPVQVTSEKGANYSDVTFAVDGNNLLGLVYKAGSRTLSLDEYNAMIEENNAAAKARAEAKKDPVVDANETMDTCSEYDYVPFSVVDTEHAVPCSFRINPKSVVKIKNASFGELKAGQDATLTFDVLNDGIDTTTGLTLTAVDKNGKSVLVGTETNGEETTTSIVDRIVLDDLIGGYTYSGVCQLSLAQEDTEAEVTITITDANGTQVAKETVSEELENSLYLSDLKAEQTDVRNQYTVTGTIENDGACKTKAGTITIGSQKEEQETEYAKAEYPELLPGQSYTFTQTIHVSPEKEFTTQKDDTGNVTETGLIYAKAGDAISETTIERNADAEEMQSIQSIQSLSLEGTKGDSLTLKNGDTVLLTPVLDSKLADKENEITGAEGLQYKFVSDNDKIINVKDNGSVTALSVGTTKLTVYAYPKNSVFKAQNQTVDSESINYNILGTEEDAYLTIPESAIYKKVFTVKVSDTGEPSVVDPPVSTQKPEETTGTTPNTTGQPSNTVLPTGSVFVKNGYQYKVTSASTITYMGAGNRAARKIIIPKTVKVKGVTYKVTAIGEKAFVRNKYLRSVVIGKNIKKISQKAFSGCKNLRTITLKTKKLNKIGRNAFSGIYPKAVFTLTGSKKKKRKVSRLFTMRTGFKKRTMRIK